MPDLLAIVRAEQRAQWQAGRRVPIQTFLDRYPALADDEDSAIDLIYSEILLREEQNEPVAWDEYCRQFPRFAEKLRRQQALHDMMKGLSASDPQATTPQPLSKETETAIAPAETAAPLFPVVPGYEIQSVLGEGSHGIVYLARQLSLNKLVALKMLRAGDLGQPEERKLLRRDAEVLAKLDHPNIVRIIDFGESGGRSFYSMEYVKGQSLEERLKAGPLPPREAAQLVETLARALHAVHEQQIVHRDLKPANILLDDHGTPKVADFGLAKRLGGDASLAASGQLVGNIAHMAPEQTGGDTSKVTPRTDIYALGVVLFESLTGRLPFAGATWLDTLQQIRHREPPSLRQFGVDRDLGTICLKCLEKEPRRRYSSAQLLADDLACWLGGKPTFARPLSWAQRRRRQIGGHPFVAGTVLLLVTALLSVSIYQHYSNPERRIEDIERRLAAGETAELIPATGFPSWFRIRWGSDTTQVSIDSEGAFAVSTWGVCLIELVRDPGRTNYSFTLQVRNGDSKPPSEVGAFFGLKELESFEGNVFALGHLTFNDVCSTEDLWLTLPPDAPRPPRPNGNPVFLRPFLTGLQANGKLLEQRLAGCEKLDVFKPAGWGGTWRSLRIDVTDQIVRAYWEDDLKVAELSNDQLNQSLRQALKSKPLAHPESAGFDPRGGIGLFLMRCNASFRRAVVGPSV